MDIAETVRSVGNDRTRLMDILIAAQGQLGCLSDETLVAIAHKLGMHYVEVLDVASFYAFFSRAPQGTHAIRFSKTPISLMKGAAAFAAAFETATGTTLGSRTASQFMIGGTATVLVPQYGTVCKTS